VPDAISAQRAPLSAWKEQALLSNLSEQVRECLRHAEDCAREAGAQTCPKMKADFLDLERRWLSLARSYEFTERLDNFCVDNKRRADTSPKPWWAK
jgi:hypothetical protein